MKDALERSQMKDRMGNLVGGVTSRVSYVGFTGFMDVYGCGHPPKMALFKEVGW